MVFDGELLVVIIEDNLYTLDENVFIRPGDSVPKIEFQIVRKNDQDRVLEIICDGHGNPRRTNEDGILKSLNIVFGDRRININIGPNTG